MFKMKHNMSDDVRVFVAYKSNTTGVTGEAGTAYPSRASESLSAVLVRFMLLDL